MPNPKSPAALRRVPIISELDHSRLPACVLRRFEIVKPFKLSADGCDAIAASCGIRRLPPLMTSTLEAAISRYNAQSMLPPVSAGQNKAAIAVALSAADKLEASLHCFADLKHSGVGAKTSVALNPLANEGIRFIRKFRAAAESERGRLQTLGRLGAEHGRLGLLCKTVRFIFESAEYAPSMLHDFVLAVLGAAKIPHSDYFDHKARLDKFFSMELQDNLLARRLRAEFEAMPPSKVRK